MNIMVHVLRATLSYYDNTYLWCQTQGHKIIGIKSYEKKN